MSRTVLTIGVLSSLGVRSWIPPSPPPSFAPTRSKPPEPAAGAGSVAAEPPPRVGDHRRERDARWPGRSARSAGPRCRRRLSDGAVARPGSALPAGSGALPPSVGCYRCRVGCGNGGRARRGLTPGTSGAPDDVVGVDRRRPEIVGGGGGAGASIGGSGAVTGGSSGTSPGSPRGNLVRIRVDHRRLVGLLDGTLAVVRIAAGRRLLDVGLLTRIGLRRRGIRLLRPPGRRPGRPEAGPRSPSTGSGWISGTVTTGPPSPCA